jgi:hypothetical protein
MSSPSKSQPSHAATPDFHCAGVRSRQLRISFRVAETMHGAWFDEGKQAGSASGMTLG